MMYLRSQALPFEAPMYPSDHALDVVGGPVLAELGLRLDPGDLQLDHDDGPQLPLDKGTRRVVHRPGMVTAGLVLHRELTNQRLAQAGSSCTTSRPYTCAVT
jgi:hypothetical protein